MCVWQGRRTRRQALLKRELQVTYGYGTSPAKTKNVVQRFLWWETNKCMCLMVAGKATPSNKVKPVCLNAVMYAAGVVHVQ